MYFDRIDEIEKIARKSDTSIFVLPDNVRCNIRGALTIIPDKKTMISIDQVRDVFHIVNNKQLAEQYIIIRPAELLTEEAGNALLKNLEEPGDKIHFVLITENPSLILPTILSRAHLYFLRQGFDLTAELNVDDKVKDLAKRLLVAKEGDLADVVDEITKKKDGARAHALKVVGAAIEMLYKSYFITEKEIFLKKLPRFSKAYDGIKKNGHIKLQIMANLC